MPSEQRFSFVERLLGSNGWRLSRINGSHHIFTKEGRWPISIPVHGGKVKAVYVRKIQKLLEEEQQDGGAGPTV